MADTQDDIVSSASARFGFKAGDRGTHTSRTIMSAELTTLLAACQRDADRAAYRHAVVADNVLAKRTGANRRLTFQRLSELYALDQAVPVFRILRLLWDADPAGRPLLAFLSAYARDPLLRLTTPAVLPVPQGARSSAPSSLTRPSRWAHLATSTRPSPTRWPTNAVSSWTQSGHLAGRQRKTRTRATPTPAAAAFALLLAHVEGARDAYLFDTDWARLLDRPKDEVIALATVAAQRGLIEFRRAGEIMEVRFTHLLTAAERRQLDEPS